MIYEKQCKNSKVGKVPGHYNENKPHQVKSTCLYNKETNNLYTRFLI